MSKRSRSTSFDSTDSSIEDESVQIETCELYVEPSSSPLTLSPAHAIGMICSDLKI